MSRVTTERGRCAVIYNPVKVSEAFRSVTERALADAGRTDPLWLETTEDDPGRSMIAEAVAAGVDLVIAAGGDGTVRIAADGLAGTQIALGIVPAGTANLLAYNLGLPPGEPEAVAVALSGEDRRIDLVRMTVDDGRPEHFAVMAGAGLDAMIMDETDPELKSKIGTGAYFLALGKALGRLPMKARVKIDDHHFHRRKAMMILIANVGRIRGLDLVPEARYDDGHLDVMIASPRTVLDWFKVAGRLLFRRQHRNDPIEIRRARRLEVQLREPDSYELDGDVAGSFSTMVAEIVPQALTVRVPAGPPGGRADARAGA